MYLEKLSLLSENNKYFRIYCELINRSSRQKDAYVEKHHIFPSCICSSYEKTDKNNIAYLSPREHFIVHRLLTKFIKCKQLKSKMHFAAFCMTRSNKSQERYKTNSRTYSILKENMSKSRKGISPSNKGIPMPEEQKDKLRKPKSEETKRKISESKTGKKHLNPSLKSREGFNNNFYGKTHTEETRKLLSDIKTGSKLKFRTDEHKKNISKALSGRRLTEEEKETRKLTYCKGEDHPFYGGLPDHMKITCEHCSKIISKSMYTRWHGPKCKLKSHT